MLRKVKLLIISEVLFLIILILPFAIGFLSQYQMVKMANQLSNTYQGLLNITVTDFKHGWMHSTANIDIHLNVPKEQNSAGQIKPTILESRFSSEITHGPLLVLKSPGKMDIKFGLAHIQSQLNINQAEPILTTLFGKQPLLTAETEISYLGNFQTNFESAKINTPEMKWDGMSGTMIYNMDMTKFKANYDISSYHMTTQGVTLETQPIHMDGNLTMSPYHLWEGNQTLEIPFIRAYQEKNIFFLLDHFKSTYHQQVQPDLFKATFETNIKKITVENTDFGPGNLLITFGIHDVKMLSEIQTALKKIHDYSQSGHMQSFDLGMNAFEQLSKLMTSGIEFNIEDFSFTTPAGNLKATAHLNLPHIEIKKEEPLYLIHELTSKVNFDFDTKIPVTVLKEFLILGEQQNYDELAMHDQRYAILPKDKLYELATQDAEKDYNDVMASNWLILTGNEVTCQITFKNGTLTVNNKVIPLGSIAQSIPPVLTPLHIMRTLSHRTPVSAYGAA